MALNEVCCKSAQNQSTLTLFNCKNFPSENLKKDLLPKFLKRENCRSSSF